MSTWFSHASGTIIMIACGSERPPRVSSSTTSSNDAESLAPSLTIGKSGRRSPSSSDLELGLARAHPVAVALHRVDLAVVRDHAERLGERPRRERVGRVARVHEREPRREALVAEVGVERLELQRRDHALVDQRAGRQRREVGAAARARRACAGGRSAGRARCRRAATPLSSVRVDCEEQLLERRRRLRAPGCRGARDRSGRRASRAPRAPPRRRSARCRPSASSRSASSRGRNAMPTA